MRSTRSSLLSSTATSGSSPACLLQAAIVCDDPDVVLDARERERVLDGIRRICLGLPETSERHVGHRGWLGVRLDRGLDWNEIARVLEDAYAEVAPPKLVRAAQVEAGPAG